VHGTLRKPRKRTRPPRTGTGQIRGRVLSETGTPVRRAQVRISGPDVAAVHFFFESMDQFQAAMGAPGTADVMADVANYTNIAPVMQISEVV